jgi:hypothetical protein
LSLAEALRDRTNVIGQRECASLALAGIGYVEIAVRDLESEHNKYLGRRNEGWQRSLVEEEEVSRVEDELCKTASCSYPLAEAALNLTFLRRLAPARPQQRPLLRSPEKILRTGKDVIVVGKTAAGNLAQAERM